MDHGENPDGILSAQPVALTVEARAHGWRVDHYLARIYPNYSRALFQKAIEQQAVLVNGLPVKASRRLRVNDMLSVRLPVAPDQTLPPENLPLEILYEDASLVVINKAAGIITHPGKANYGGTLAGALQFHFNTLSDVAGKLRPGIVHRLDRDTSGVIVIAKDNQVHHALSRQFERREVTKEYRAIVWGVVDSDTGLIQTYVRVNPKRREAMMVCEEGGNARQAVTRYEVLERFADFSYLRYLPRQGGHINCASIPGISGTPLSPTGCTAAGPVSPANIWPASTMRGLRAATRETAVDEADVLIRRQALHAFRLAFCHPATGKPLEFTAPLPADMENTLAALRNSSPPHML